MLVELVQVNVPLDIVEATREMIAKMSRARPITADFAVEKALEHWVKEQRQGFAAKAYPLVIEPPADMHINHCCETCGCKYGEDIPHYDIMDGIHLIACSVVAGRQKQRYPCKGDCSDR